MTKIITPMIFRKSLPNASKKIYIRAFVLEDLVGGWITLYQH